MLGALAQDEPTKVTEPKDSKPDIGDSIKSLRDAITSIVSEVQSDYTMISAALPPTAAYPYLHAENPDNHCSSRVTGFVSALTNAQASCSCYVNASNLSPDQLDKYTSGCDDSRQAQTVFWLAISVMDWGCVRALGM